MTAQGVSDVSEPGFTSDEMVALGAVLCRFFPDSKSPYRNVATPENSRTRSNRLTIDGEIELSDYEAALLMRFGDRASFWTMPSQPHPAQEQQT